MQSATMTEVSNAFAYYADRAVGEPLTITRHGQAALVLLSAEEYARLKWRDRIVLTIDQCSRELRDAVAAAHPAPEADAYNHEVD